MTTGRTKATTLLFLGDIVIFFATLWLTLLVRYGSVPSEALFNDHIVAFFPLFALWLLVFYMAGLYGKRIILFKTALFGAILRIQIANIILAALYFFFVPGIALAPKTNLFLYLIISLGFILVWRLYVFPRVTRPVSREHAALIGSGIDIERLAKEVNENPRYHLSFPIVESPEQLCSDYDAFAKQLHKEGVTVLVVDSSNDKLRPFLPRLYELAFVSPGYSVLDFHEVYEEVFDRVPLSLLEYDWFLKNISVTTSSFYPVAKRCVDIMGGLAMGVITLVALPFVAVAMRIEGKGPLFISQDRIGQFGKRVKSYKFRSMRLNKAASSEWTTEEKRDNPITKVGNFLRRTSLDEFPQFVNILSGEISLIGPRNDVEGLGKRLGEEIPYYQIRYIVKPGITGWAQINQQYEQGNISPQSVEETKMRLAYDFYYIKNRSFALDIVIALKTIKRMLFRVSSW
jgi:lipopolysaccharide/colanic/teichoic acid biosynthesis glycosyltransferase